MIQLYGLTQCDTIRKARRWLDQHQICYQFHDFHKQGLDPAQLMGWVEQVGWETLLNRRGTTWRNAPATLREACDEIGAIQFMLEHPAVIKRPVLDRDGLLEIGFCDARYEEIFG